MKVSLTSNLMKLEFTNPLQKVYIYSIDIFPEIANDNYTLQKKLYKTIENKLSPYFIKMSFAGYNLFGSTKNPQDEIIIEENVEKTDYKVTFKKVGLLNFSEIVNKEGIEQKKKNFIEKLIKDILLSSKDRIRFGTDRMVISMDQDNMIRNSDNSTIYKGYFTSAQITESGLYLLVLNMNKYVSGKTMYEKIQQIKEENRHNTIEEIKQKIEDYIEEHRTVLTTYGSLRAYRIESIDFEKTPDNTSFNIKTNDGMKTISIFNYYLQQYKQKIKDKEQPLLIAEKKNKDKKLLNSKEDKNENENKDVIYLVPELVLITGIENEVGSRSKRDNTKVIPRNGLFRTQQSYDGITITKYNFMYIYNRKDRTDFKSLMFDLFQKAKSKKINVTVDARDVYSYGLNYTYNWNDIKDELDKIHFDKELKMVVIFFDNNLERYYTKFKEYFTNIIKVDSQLISTRRLSDKKRAGSIMFKQINTKMGGINYYIEKNKLISNKIYLVIGLESKKFGKDSIDYVMTYSYNPKMSRTQTIPITCKNNTQDITQTLSNLLDQALNSLHKLGAPHPPDYIIIFRQGGNHVQNLRYAENEIPAFLENINKKKEKFESFKKYTKLIYICCNLKGDLKFFEENRNNANNRYSNPQSGLCVDEKIVETGKYEFYLQPQFVNQGTATPCHYEVLYQDIDEKNSENNLSIEELENLSFQLSYYYWTWSGAVRVPGVLRLSTTAIDFYSRCLNHRIELEGKKFRTPGFI